MKNKELFVSIVVPTKDRPDYLYRAIKSILNQTYKNWECIVIDDNSKIPATKSIGDLINNDKRFTLIRNKKSEFASKSRNIGIHKSKGELIAFLDDDDYWDKNKLSEQLEFMIKNNFEVTYCWTNLIDSDNNLKIREPNISGNIFDLMLDEQPLCNCSTFIVSKEALMKVGYFNTLLKRGNDGDLIRKLSAKYQIGLLKKRLVFYQINSRGTNISTNNKIGIKRSLKSYKYRLYFFKKDLINRPLKYANINLEIARCYAKLNMLKMSLKYFLKALKVFTICFNKTFYKIIRVFILIIFIIFRKSKNNLKLIFNSSNK